MCQFNAAVAAIFGRQNSGLLFLFSAVILFKPLRLGGNGGTNQDPATKYHFAMNILVWLLLPGLVAHSVEKGDGCVSAGSSRGVCPGAVPTGAGAVFL